MVKHHTDLSFLSSSQRRGNEGHARCLTLLQVAVNQFGCIQLCTNPAHKPSLTHSGNQQSRTPQKPQHHLSKKRTQYGRRKAGLFSAYVLCQTLKYKKLFEQQGKHEGFLGFVICGGIFFCQAECKLWLKLFPLVGGIQAAARRAGLPSAAGSMLFLFVHHQFGVVC